MFVILKKPSFQILWIIFSMFYISNSNSFNHLFYNKWVPIVPYDSYIWSEGPQKITICNNDYVLWKNNDQINLQQNICPHRCAPLSEGYITKDGNIACSYHGWSFDNNGQLKNIPQMSKCSSHKNLNIVSYETKVVDNIVWAFITNLESKHENKSSLISNTLSNFINNNISRFYNERLSHNPNTIKYTFMRELPYDYYILLENFFDPSHIPFAHHKLQSERKAGSPINSTIKETFNSIIVNFSDFSYKDPKTNTFLQRNGSIEFQPPYYYKLSNDDSKSYIKALHIYCIPIKEQQSRVLVQYEFNEISTVYQIYKLLPIWLKHYLTNVFFDSDTLLLVKQEENIRKQIYTSNKLTDKSYQLDNHPFYRMPATSDIPITHLRRFIRPYIKYSTTNVTVHNKQDIGSREKILDRYEQHVKTCKHCKQALTNTNFFKTYGTSFILSLYFIDGDPIIGLIAIFNFLLMNYFKKIFIFQDYRHFDLNP